MLADSLFRLHITPFCSLLPSYPSYSLLPSYHLLLSHLTTSYSLLPSYHLLPPTCHLLLSHLTTSLFSHLTTSLLSYLTTSYHQLVTPLLSLTHIFALLPPFSLVSSLSPHLLLLLTSSAMLLLFQLANFPLVNPAPTQLLFSKHSISKNRTFFLISHYYHFTMKT